MDDDLKAYLRAMEARLEAGQAAIRTDVAAMEGRLEGIPTGMTAMEGRLEAIRTDMAAMEGRLMGRINDVQERMIQGFAATDKAFAAADKRMGNLELAVISVVEMHRNTNVLLSTIGASFGDLTGRVTRLENKQ